MNTKQNLMLIPLCLILITVSTGCFAPINSTFESAKLLDKREIEVQGSYSHYGAFGVLGEGYRNTNNNLGFAVGYGVSDKYNLKLRYERMHLEYPERSNSRNDYRMNYLELNNKFSLMKDKIAVSVPIGTYINGDESFVMLDPRFIFTLRKNDIFEVNLIPKAHILLRDDIRFMPGINLGLGFSSDLNKWAVRPEFGYDGYFTFGVGVSYYISNFSR